jgi:phosphatidate cytidylyltransferase
LLRWRLISAAVILPALLTLVWLDFRQAVFGVVGVWLFPVLLGVSVLATEEVLSLLSNKGYRPVAWVIYLGNLLIPAAASLPMIGQLIASPLPADDPLGRFGWPLVVLALAATMVLIAEMRQFERPGQTIVIAALGIFTLVYVGLLVGFMAQLRLFGQQSESGAARGDWGLLALVSTLVVVKFADVGAYAIGRTFGRTKLTPKLSPGKTWEGAVGGVATACVASWMFFRFAGPWFVGVGYAPPPLWASLAYGLVLALAGMTGDLAESLLKRDMERKDSSTWLPGLGGVLDIVDAVLVAAPVSYLCWVLGLVGPGG